MGFARNHWLRVRVSVLVDKCNFGYALHVLQGFPCCNWPCGPPRLSRDNRVLAASVAREAKDGGETIAACKRRCVKREGPVLMAKRKTTRKNGASGVALARCDYLGPS